MIINKCIYIYYIHYIYIKMYQLPCNFFNARANTMQKHLKSSDKASVLDNKPQQRSYRDKGH